MREKVRSDNLETIKMHILTRLNLTQLPNITVPINVPNNILENFFKNFNNLKSKQQSNQQHKSVNERNGDNNEELVDVDDEETSDMQQDQNYEQLHGVEFDYVHNNFNTHQDLYKADDGSLDEHNIYDYNHDSFFSNDKSIYIFPKLITRLRHNHKSTDIISFPFGNALERYNIERTKLHLYIRGRAWARQQQELKKPKRIYANHQNIKNVLTIHIFRPTNPLLSYKNSTITIPVKIDELKDVPIPRNEGKWIEIDLSKHLKRQQTTEDLQLIVKGAHTWMRPFIVTSVGRNKPLSMHIELVTHPNRHRSKRSTSLDCQETDNEPRCCRYPLKVNFTSFGWHFVVAPTSFDAYFCNGECKVGYLEQYTHTHIASLTTSATPCCSPTKMSPLSLLYFNMEQNLVLSTIPNMSVEKCTCS